jgi:hypothetical protein
MGWGKGGGKRTQARRRQIGDDPSALGHRHRQGENARHRSSRSGAPSGGGFGGEPPCKIHEPGVQQQWEAQRWRPATAGDRRGGDTDATVGGPNAGGEPNTSGGRGRGSSNEGVRRQQGHEPGVQQQWGTQRWRPATAGDRRGGGTDATVGIAPRDEGGRGGSTDQRQRKFWDDTRTANSKSNYDFHCQSTAVPTTTCGKEAEGESQASEWSDAKF